MLILGIESSGHAIYCCGRGFSKTNAPASESQAPAPSRLRTTSYLARTAESSLNLPRETQGHDAADYSTRNGGGLFQTGTGRRHRRPKLYCVVGSLLVGLRYAKGLCSRRPGFRSSASITPQGYPHFFFLNTSRCRMSRCSGPAAIPRCSWSRISGRYRRLGTRARTPPAVRPSIKLRSRAASGHPGANIIDDISLAAGHRKAVKIPRAHVRGAPMDFQLQRREDRGRELP